MGQDIPGSTGEEQEHAAPGIELWDLNQLVVNPLLLSLGLQHMLLDDGGDLVDLLLHATQIGAQRG